MIVARPQRTSLVQLSRQVPPVGGMQCALQILRQHRLSYLQVHLLQAEKNLVLL
jgi:hypothetical protein